MAAEEIPATEMAAPVTALYIGDLDVSVTEEELRRLFDQTGDVESVKICMDQTTGRSLGYGYVNYSNPQDAAKAIEDLNSTFLNGKRIRISYSARDASLRNNVVGNIFVNNLDKEIDDKILQDIFSPFGSIISSKIRTDPSGNSKGYGFVHYDSEESARKAIEQLNGVVVHGKALYVGPYLSKQDREMLVDKTKFTNVFVKNITESTTEDDFMKIFGRFGPITSAAIMCDEKGNSKCYGFVNFEDARDAIKSVEMLNGRIFDGKKWYVGRAQKKSEREQELKLRFANETLEKENPLGHNLYIKNLGEQIDKDKLKELFSPFGSIISCKVMHDPRGISKGSGFVAFSTSEEASRAMSEMNGKMVGSKPLYVATAQKKEDRIAHLQAMFSDVRLNSIVPPVTPHLPMYSPRSPKFDQQMFYGNAPPAILPPMLGFGYQQQFVPSVGSSGSRFPSGMFGMIQQGPRKNGKRPNFVQHSQPPFPPMHQQMLMRGNAYCFPPGYVFPNSSAQVTRQEIRPQPKNEDKPVGTLASALANASSPTEQRMMLGENLYPLVEKLEHEMAGKVTGMLLEMDQTEVLHLLESPQSLKAKVEEAMEVIRNAPS